MMILISVQNIDDYFDYSSKLLLHKVRPHLLRHTTRWNGLKRCYKKNIQRIQGINPVFFYFTLFSFIVSEVARDIGNPASGIVTAQWTWFRPGLWSVCDDEILETYVLLPWGEDATLTILMSYNLYIILIF